MQNRQLIEYITLLPKDLKDSKNENIHNLALADFLMQPESIQSQQLITDLQRANLTINIFDQPVDKMSLFNEIGEDVSADKINAGLKKVFREAYADVKNNNNSTGESIYESIQAAYRQECSSLGGTVFTALVSEIDYRLKVKVKKVENILDVETGTLTSKNSGFSISFMTEEMDEVVLCELPGSIEVTMALKPATKENSSSPFVFELQKIDVQGNFLHDILMQNTLPDIALYPQEVFIEKNDTITALKKIWLDYQNHLVKKITQFAPDEKNIEEIIKNNKANPKFQAISEKYQAATHLLSALEEKIPKSSLPQPAVTRLLKFAEVLIKNKELLARPRTDLRRSLSENSVLKFFAKTSKGNDVVSDSEKLLLAFTDKIRLDYKP